jgi:hypothetical protein
MQTREHLAAELSDLSVPDWRGEIEFRRELGRDVSSRRESILEVACETRHPWLGKV